jgi:hypothetical protein
MSLLESEQRRSRRAQRKHRKQVARKGHKHPSALDAPLDMANDNQCMTFREWCRLCRFSERTGRRIIKSGNGPVVTQLGEKRMGITVGANKRWQEARARG